MIHGNLRFMGYTLQHNPHTLEVTSSSNISQYNTSDFMAITQNTGNNPIAVKGEGVFYGENAFEQYMELKTLSRKCKSGVLSVSGIDPFYAYLTQIKLKCTPVDDCVEYTFMFTETPDYSVTENSTAPTQYIVQQGEDLWDISYKLNIPIEKLIKFNSNLKNTYDISEGDVIRINDI